MWDERYGATDDYVYGTAPNDYLRDRVGDASVVDKTALCLADGEGRNGVWLASLGYRVVSVDLSSVGLAKARSLAAASGVELHAVHADLATYDLGVERHDLIVSIFAHVPPDVRRRVNGAIPAALRADGECVIEAYTVDQIGRGTGGPRSPEPMYALEELRVDLAALAELDARETVRSVVEGPGHTGEGSVVQFHARKREMSV